MRNDRNITWASDCNPEHKEGLQNAIKNTRCQPYNRSVALKPMSGQIFNPPSVSVPQCDGIVAEGHVCAPTETKIIQVPVSVSTSGRSNPKCALVNVVEHIKCMYVYIFMQLFFPNWHVYDRNY